MLARLSAPLSLDISQIVAPGLFFSCTLAVCAAPWVRGMWVDYLVVDGFAGLSESIRVILMKADARRDTATAEWH